MNTPTPAITLAADARASNPLEMSEDFRNTVRARPLAYSLDDYWTSVAGVGPLGFTWKDKPHRIVYDLLGAVRHYSNADAAQPLASDANSLTDAHIDAIAESVGINFEPRFGMSSVGNVQLRRFARAILAAATATKEPK